MLEILQVHGCSAREVKIPARAVAAVTPTGRIVAETFRALFEVAHEGEHLADLILCPIVSYKFMIFSF